MSVLRKLYRRFVHGKPATGPRYSGTASIPQGQGVVYVYRPTSRGWLMNQPQLVVNGELVGVLLDGGYLSVELPVGEHELKLETANKLRHWKLETEIRKVEITEGVRLYFCVSQQATDDIFDNTFDGVPKLEQVKEDAALREISELRLSVGGEQ